MIDQDYLVNRENEGNVHVRYEQAQVGQITSDLSTDLKKIMENVDDFVGRQQLGGQLLNANNMLGMAKQEMRDAGDAD